jgi:hypothetical protein
MTSSAISSATSHGIEATPAPDPQGQVPLWRSVAILVSSTIVWIFFWTSPHTALSPKSGVVMHLPGYVDVDGGFVGTTAEVTEPERYILPKDTEFARKNYSDFPGPDRIFCGIVLSGVAQQSIHRPEVCLIAQGWSIINQEDIKIPLESGRVLTVRNLTIKKVVPYNGKAVTLERYNMYWFVGENITTASHVTRAFLSSWDRIVHNRAHRWAYVTVASGINPNPQEGELNAAQTKNLMIDFIKKIVPTFQKSEMVAPDAS